MELHHIALPSAHALETLRQKGITDEAILTHITTKDLNKWEDEHLYFDELLQIASDDKNTLSDILTNGYKVKFMTIRGLQTLLKVKWDLNKNRDYELTETGITNLQLNDSQLEILKQIIAKNCTIHERANTVSITLA